MESTLLTCYNTNMGLLVDYRSVCSCKIHPRNGYCFGDARWMCKGGLVCKIKTPMAVIRVNLGLKESWIYSIPSLFEWLRDLKVCDCEWQTVFSCLKPRVMEGRGIEKDTGNNDGDIFPWRTALMTSYRDDRKDRVWNRSGSFVYGQYPRAPIVKKRSIVRYYRQKMGLSGPRRYWMEFSRLRSYRMLFSPRFYGLQYEEQMESPGVLQKLRGAVSSNGTNDGASNSKQTWSGAIKNAMSPEYIGDVSGAFADGKEMTRNLRSVISEARPMLDMLHGGFFKDFAEFTAISREALEMSKGEVSFVKAFDKIARDGVNIGKPTKMSAIEVIVMILTSIYLFCTFSDWKQSVAMVINQFAAMGVGSKLTRWIMTCKEPIETLRNAYHRRNLDFQEQSLDFGKLVGPFAYLLSTGITTLLATDDKRPIPSYHKAGLAAQSFNHINTMSKAFEASLTKAGDLLWEMYTGLPPGSKNISELTIELETWMEAVAQTAGDTEWMKDFTINHEKHQIVIDLVKNGRPLIQLIKSLPKEVQQSVLLPVNMAMRTLTKAQDILKQLTAPSLDKAEPVSIIFMGGTGVGKTTMVKQFAIDLLSMMPEKVRNSYTSDRFIFTKDKVGEYYDGYDGHFAFFIDELYQSLATADEIQDSLSFITLVNSHSTPLNMAQLEMKNKICFTSPFIFATTNAVNWDGFAIRCPQALKRRRGVILEPVVKDEFTKSVPPESKELDGPKWREFAQQNNKLISRPEFARFNIINGDTDGFIAQGVEYRDVLKVIMTLYNEKAGTFEELNQCQNAALEAAFAGTMYEPQADSTMAAVISRIRESKIQRSSEYLLKTDLPVFILLSQLQVDGVIREETFEEDMDRQSASIKEWVRIWNSLNHDKKVEATLMITMVSSNINMTLRRNVYRSVMGVPVEILTSLKEGSTWEDLRASSKQYNHPLHDWKQKVKSTLVSFKENFPWKEFVIILTSIAALGGLAFGIYYAAKSRKKKVTFVDKGESHTHTDTNKSHFQKQRPHSPRRVSYSPNCWDYKAESRNWDLQAVNIQDKESNLLEFHIDQTLVDTEPETTYEDVNGNRIGKQSVLDIPWEDQAIYDQVWESTMLMKVVRSTCLVSLTSFGIEMTRARGILVCSDFLLVPQHFYRQSQNTSNVVLEVQKVGGHYKINVKDIKAKSIGMTWKYDDVVLLKLPAHKIVGCDIVKYFIKKDEVCEITDTYGELVVPSMQGLVRHATHIVAQEEFLERKPDTVTLISPEDNRHALVGWHYLASTQKGDCGSPLIRWDPSATTKIIGIHAAGYNSDQPKIGCFATIVHQEFLVQAMAELGSSVYTQQSDVGRPFYGDSHLLKPAMELVTYVGRKEGAFMPMSKTKIRPSPFQGILAKPFTSPVTPSMAAGGSLDKVLSKFQRETPLVDTTLVHNLSLGKYFTSDLIDAKLSRELLTWDQVMQGLDDLGNINPMSSMGYPYSIKNMKKSDIMVHEPGIGYRLLEDTEFYADLLSKEERIQQGEVPEWVWITYMKDERINKEKAAAGKIRLFMACPFDLTLLSRKYFGNFIDAIHKKRFEIGCLVGIDPHGLEWHSLALKLLAKNKRICTEDFSNWDRTVPKEFLAVFFHWAKLYYGKRYTLAHQAIEHAILCPMFQTSYFRYRVPSGNPSGSPFTAEMNSISNIIITMYCLVKTGIPEESVMNQSSIFAYGDDKVWTAKFDYEMSAYVAELTNLGLTVTSPKKDGSLPELLDISEIDFLQRRFGLVDGIYRGQLKLEIIVESLLWVSGTTNHREALEDTVRSAFVELQQYEPVKVGELCSRILHCCSTFKIPFPITEHLIRALTEKEESWSGTNLENMLLHMGGAFWNQSLSYDKLPVTTTSLMEIDAYECFYVGLDIVRDFPIITKGVFYHTGFRFKKGVEWYKYELVFSDRGVVWVPASYKPDFCYSVAMRAEYFVDSLVIAKKYHKVRWNCIAWAEWVMFKFKVKPPILLHQNLLDFIRSHYQNMLYEEQAGEGTLGEGVTPFGEDSATVSKGVFQNVAISYAPATTREFKALLETEAMIDSGVWNNAAVDSQLEEIEFPKALLHVKQFQAKMMFNALFSANIHVRLKVSTNQFQQGQLLLVWEPLGHFGMAGGVKLHTWAQTAMPSVVLNAAVQNEVSMTIPFISPFNFLRLNEQPKLGYLRLKVLNPLRDQSTEKRAYYTFYANFTDVVVMAPTPLQKNTGRGKCENVFPCMKAQSDDEATEKTKMGVISGVTSTVAAVADLVGKIPIFSSIAGTVSSVAHVATNIATYLGLSKPNSLAATMPVIPRPFTSVSYADGLDMSVIVGTSSRNHVYIQPSLFGSCVDEMSIEYIVKTPQVIDTFPWSKDDQVSTILRAIPVVPTVGGKIRGHDAARNFCQMSPMGYVAICAKYWRGSMQFKFQFVATGFHQGRVAIGYVPLGLQKDFDLATTSHIIYDLGLETSVEFTVPFVSDRMYNRVPNVFEEVSIKEPVATGVVVVKVLNNLKGPESVWTQIDVNVWVSGGDDMQFAVPTLDQVRLYDYGYQKDSLSECSIDYPEVDSDGIFEYDEQATQQDTSRTREQVQLGSNSMLLPGYEPTPSEGVNGVVMGETIHSLRDILKIFVKKFETKTKLQGRQMCYDIPAHSYLTNLDGLEDTYYDHLTRIYRMSRGSVRQKLVCSKISGKISVILNVDSDQEPFTWYASEKVCEGSPWGMCVPEINPTLEYMVPFYSKEKFQVHGKGASLRSVTIAAKTMAFDTGAELVVYGYESIGDDFSMGYLTGPPVLSPKPLPIKSLAHLISEGWEHGWEVPDNKIDGIKSYKLEHPNIGTSLTVANHILAYNQVYTQQVKDPSKTADYMLHVFKDPVPAPGSYILLEEDVDHVDCNYGFLLFTHYSVGPTKWYYGFKWGKDLPENFQGMWFHMYVKDRRMKMSVLYRCNPSQVRKNFGTPIQQMLNDKIHSKGTFEVIIKD